MTAVYRRTVHTAAAQSILTSPQPRRQRVTRLCLVRLFFKPAAPRRGFVRQFHLPRQKKPEWRYPQIMPGFLCLDAEVGDDFSLTVAPYGEHVMSCARLGDGRVESP